MKVMHGKDGNDPCLPRFPSDTASHHHRGAQFTDLARRTGNLLHLIAFPSLKLYNDLEIPVD